jgi:uncharacterized protein (DUF2141 family)
MLRSSIFASVMLAGAGAARATQIDVAVTGVQPNGTNVFVSLCDGGLDAASCRLGERRRAEGPVVSLSFGDLPPGTYAVVAFQDLDGTGTLPRSKLGLPLEPYGLSNDAGRRRRPTFAQAAFQVGGEARTVVVRLRSVTAARDAQ